MPVENIQRNIDPPILRPGDLFNPGAGVMPNYGPRADLYGANFDTYFTLERSSPSLGLLGASPADILVNNLAENEPGFHTFAPFGTMGLRSDDAIDALALNRPLLSLQTLPLRRGFNLIAPFLIDGRYDPNAFESFLGIDPFYDAGPADLALFSLDPSSPSLDIFDRVLDRTLSPADIFITDFDGTFALYASAESLGLSRNDNVDGLDSVPVPEPNALGAFFGALVLLVWLRNLRPFTTPMR